MVRTHQPGQAVFKSVLPEDVYWNPFAAFPPSDLLAVLVGHDTHGGMERQTVIPPAPGGYG